MPVELIHDPRVSSAYPGHATAAARLTAEQPLEPAAGAVDGLRRAFEAPGGRERADAAALRWRGVYDAMGAKARYKPSVGALLELYDRAGGLPIPIAVVELYCWFSLVEGVPMAGYRPERLAGPLRLTLPGAGMPFTPLNQPRGSTARTLAREVAYVDDEKAICRYWNLRDCDETKLTEGVCDALFIFDLVGEPGGGLEAEAAALTARFAALFAGAPRLARGLAGGASGAAVSL
jgi:DNA/RNA-binding domain of Phe-tRNA-synthetase-like protein